ncbi:serine/threonine protein kinase [Arthroderma uncinatum]|uniref:serine/threonine protein kinase n=1 Tax=Arthroderma uncinatum TaxID=74035 RepID=UPI00144AF270|nr:serine/threonine protein kinase [Arthroderma uncinatum]KAF3484117.1 serine/threonine protein kinase [Arthroderma uncinatum]
MEYAPGVGADTQWFNTTKYQKHALATGIVDIETKLFTIPFSSTGSLYFKTDIPPELQSDLYAPETPGNDEDSRKYCIGPIVDYMFWYGKRSELDIYRGPWNDSKKYLAAVAEKEVKWIEKFGKPLECDFPHNTVFPGMNSHEDYLSLLKKYLMITPYLLPQDMKSALNKPTIRHPDLTPSNVFICPDTHQVKCIIDWQHTSIKPLSLIAGYPRLFENPDAELSKDLKPPSYPEDYNTMDPEAKANADELFRRQSLFYLYRVFNGGRNKVHLKAMQDPFYLLRQHLVESAGRQWAGNLMTLRGALMSTCNSWSYASGQDSQSGCPISFSEDEIRKQTDDDPMWCNLNALVSHWREELGGLTEEGWVRTEAYDDAVKRNQSLIEEFSEGGSTDELGKIKRGWPFQDREEFF